MEQIITKEEFDDLMSLKGEVRGAGLKTYANFVLKREGIEGLKKLEDTITSLGYPIRCKKLKTMGFYPAGLEALTLLVIKRLFNYDDEKFQEMGESLIKTYLIPILFVRYLFSLEKALEKAQRAWRNQQTFGDIVVVELNKEKKYAIFRIENFRIHPLHCQMLLGLFSALTQILFKSEGSCEETKCIHRGDEYHEFVLRW